MKELMKVGDSVIIINHSNWHGYNYKLTKIIKVNKITYKVENGDLYYIDGLSKREARDIWSRNSSRIQPYEKEVWEELSLKVKNKKMAIIQAKLSEIIDNYDYELVLESLKYFEHKED